MSVTATWFFHGATMKYILRQKAHAALSCAASYISLALVFRIAWRVS